MLGRNKNSAALPGSNSAPITPSEVMERLAEDYMKDRKWRRIFKFLLLGLFVLNASLRRAFEAKMSKGIVLRINSPGGSPVQSDQINAEIVRLRSIYPDKRLHVVISDVCASGGYYIAAAADQIFANPSSIVGSIGVRMDSFGFVDTLEKLGVERRSITAGSNKAILDPFLPIKESQRAHAEQMLGIVHQQFIDRVNLLIELRPVEVSV